VIKIGIIGAGVIGTKRAESIALFPKKSSLTAVCDIDIDKARELAGRKGAGDDWNQLLMGNICDAVVIATPNKYLKEITLAALLKRRHVLCEKPLGRNAEEALQMYLVRQKVGKILKTGFNHRHHPAISRAKSLVERGEIGAVYFLKCTYGHGGRPGYEKEWRANREICGGGELLDQGVHVVDLFRWFLGEFEEAQGMTATYFWDMEVEDNAFATFRTKKGQIASMHTSWTQWKNKFQFEVFGEKGYLMVDGLGGSYGIEKLVIGKRKRDQNNYVGGAPEEEVVAFPGPDISWQEEWKEFISAIEENREPLGSGYDGLMANRMIEALYKSARLNRKVKIEK